MESNLLILFSILFGFVFHPNLVNSKVLGQISPSVINSSLIPDSYNNPSSLEDFPEVCEEYSDERCASFWFKEMNEIAIRNHNRLRNVAYRYASNINERNFKLLNMFQIEALRLDKMLQMKVKKFKWKQFRSPEIRRVFGILTSTIKSKNKSICNEIVQIHNKMISIYNSAQPCFKTCLEPGESSIKDLFRNERDYDKLTGFWTAWRDVTGAKMRYLFIKRKNLENEGAKENGYSDAASFNLINNYEEKDFKETTIKIFESILPLYKELHAYVRHCLAIYYPGRFVKEGPIPAHLLGNIWAQEWNNIFPIIKKCGGDLEMYNFQNEANEKISNLSVNKIFKMAEEFYESIGMYKMTNEFWERSVLTQPAGELMDCHNSAYDFVNGADFRILMCAKPNVRDFTTIHHEMGHIEYFMAYRHLPLVFRDSANEGFHEAIGDAIALAVKTPEHLQKIGLISHIPESGDFDIEYLLATALEKIVFLPFALTMDSFIWGVYNGSVPTSELNKYWWDLTYRYQGLKSPVERSENDFDPAAKYHIASCISYIQYFISFIIQFQFYESMCNISGHKGPLHRCDFYQSKEAGSKLLEMLKQGKSKHWKETFQILTGTTNIQSESILKFFEPLHKWLRVRNRKLNIPVGW